ncbi:NADPH-dependent FMN reductase [Pseudooceanicola nanhaiensis]|jgi:NAD(P)H-dependent FMN reductase|uniref:FMN reductase n=1 Tax=Pseudooceanicola nanhaiensis TaxID=375761 RepID=A0A917SIV2_9RHOB|nr:NAD(P)H-dependent oxidoreductase [Pseudooceanicola nanhaiensis]GGL82882.1 FMN reductase [Pseudooceanicola nanhaiensis]
MTTKPRIAVIVGTTRPTRWGVKPAEWIKGKIEQDGRMSADILDIASYDLPFFDEPASNRWMPSQNPQAVKWQRDLDQYDGFVFVVAEYNHSISGALKNAFDQAFNEWNRKPAAVVGYGGVGAARAVEHLRAIAVEVHMVNVPSAVHIAGGEFVRVHPLGGVEDDISAIEDKLNTNAMIDDLYWWTDALKTARAATRAEAA